MCHTSERLPGYAHEAQCPRNWEPSESGKMLFPGHSEIRSDGWEQIAHVRVRSLSCLPALPV